MAKYIDIVLTTDGTFFIAPPWTIAVGDYISVENIITGAIELREVKTIATDTEDGDFIKLVEAYIGAMPCKVKQKYRQCDVHWEDENVPE